MQKLCITLIPNSISAFRRFRGFYWGKMRKILFNTLKIRQRFKINRNFFKWTNTICVFNFNKSKIFQKVQRSAVVSEKKGTFVCELILERYVYLHNTQKQQKITNYVRNKSFVEFYLVYNGVCLKLLGSIL